MDSKKVKVPYQDKMVDGEEISFKEIQEQWNEYDLSDGTKLKIKLLLVKVVRIDEYNAQGEPVYVVATQNALNASAPEELKKKPN
jgi:hypothetical protein